MFIHILNDLTKEEANTNIDYIRVLGFNDIGKNYLSKLKKETDIPIITKLKDVDSPLLNIEKRASYIYSLIANDNSLIEKEKLKPIYKV